MKISLAHAKRVIADTLEHEVALSRGMFCSQQPCPLCKDMAEMVADAVESNLDKYKTCPGWLSRKIAEIRFYKGV